MLSPMFVTKDPIVRPTRDLGGNNRRNSRSSVSRAGGGFAGLQQQQQQQQQQGQPPHLMQSQTRPHSDRIVLPQMASDVARSHISSPSTDTAPLSDASSFNSDPRSYNFQQNLDGPGETFTLAPTSPSKLESDTSERGSSEGNSHLAQLPVQQPDREDHVVSLGYGRQQPESKLQTIQNRRKVSSHPTYQRCAIVLNN